MSTVNGRAFRPPVAKTADYTIQTPHDNGQAFSNEGATGAVTFKLPPATPGQWYEFFVVAGQALRIDPDGTETAALHTGAAQAAGKYVTCSTGGGYIRLVCLIAGKWACGGAVGTWTAES